MKLASKKHKQNFGKKNFNSMVVGAHQSFQIFRKNTCFLESNGALSKFFCGILHYLISIIIKKSALKTQSYIKHASQLKT